MADNALVTPQAFNVPRAIDQRTNDSQQNQPQALPCTVTKIVGELVTVKIEATSKFTFPQITIPQAFSEWVREPTQVGDKGWAVPSQYYIGGQSGLSGGTANLYPRANMTTLVFQHNSQKTFPHNTNRDLNAAFINGPNGVVLQDTGGACKFTLTPSSIIITVGGNTVTIDATGIKCTQEITAGYGGGDSVTLQQHVHPGTAPPTPGT